MNKFFKNFFLHLNTITTHKLLVMKYCFKLGLYKQGLLHDLSKYSPIEFIPGVKYFSGERSPIDLEKMDKGYSLGWLHHKGINKHHWEYWYDFIPNGYGPIEMPLRYIAESVCDRISASKVYLKENYRDDSAYDYFIKNLEHTPLHPNTEKQMKYLLSLIKDYGEEEGLKQIKAYLKKSI